MRARTQNRIPSGDDCTGAERLMSNDSNYHRFLALSLAATAPWPSCSRPAASSLILMDRDGGLGLPRRLGRRGRRPSGAGCRSGQVAKRDRDRVGPARVDGRVGGIGGRDRDDLIDAGGTHVHRRGHVRRGGNDRVRARSLILQAGPAIEPQHPADRESPSIAPYESDLPALVRQGRDTQAGPLHAQRPARLRVRRPDLRR